MWHKTISSASSPAGPQVHRPFLSRFKVTSVSQRTALSFHCETQVLNSGCQVCMPSTFILRASLPPHAVLLTSGVSVYHLLSRPAVPCTPPYSCPIAVPNGHELGDLSHFFLQLWKPEVQKRSYCATMKLPVDSIPSGSIYFPALSSF